MAPSRKSGGGADAEKKKKKSTEATKTNKTVSTKRKEGPKSKDLVVPSSSTKSQTHTADEKNGGEVANQRTIPKKTKTKSKSKPKTKPTTKAEPKPKSKPRSKEKEEDNEAEEGTSVCAFPMNRIKVIIRSGGAADSRITQEAIFLINKASEKFIQNMCEDSYISDKNYFGYKHISSLVSRERRYDFLSDFVPMRVKAVDALAETHAADA